jgi:translation initiation factor 1
MSSPKKNEKIGLSGGETLGQNPFAALSGLNLPSAPLPAQPAAMNSGKPATPAPQKNRGRVDVLREKTGRGGKTVTVAAGFTGIGLPEKEQLAKKMQKACGVGGTVKDGRIEIQGDKRDEVARILAEAGFRPVFSGG